jgi:hypothetical protein
VFTVIMFAALGLSARWGANRLEQRTVPRPLLQVYSAHTSLPTTGDGAL